MPEWFGWLTGGLCFGSLRGNGEHLSRSRRVAHEKKRKEAPPRPPPNPTHHRSTTLVRSGGHLAARRRALVSVAVLCKTRISAGLFFFSPLFSFCLFFRGQTGWAAVPETQAKVSQNYLNTFLETAAVQFK